MTRQAEQLQGVDVRCAHCTLPVPRGLVDASREAQFCCGACETAYEIIHASDLKGYYAMLARDPGEKRPAASTGRDYADFDDESFRAVHCDVREDGSMGGEFVLEGIHCAACVWLLEKLPEAMHGVLDARVEYGKRLLWLRWDPARARLSEIARFVDRLGYPVHPARAREAAEARRREDRESLIRIGGAAALAGNTMLIAFALYSGMFTGMDPLYEMFFRAVSAVLGITCVCWPGAVFFRGAVSSLRMKTLHMDVPIALALGVGLLHGVVNTAMASGEVYFDTLSILVFLLLCGRWIQSRQQRKAADAVELLYSLTPSFAVKIEGEIERRVPIDAVRVGDRVRVGVGESVAVDGEVVAGESEIDLSFLTGESRPVVVGVGDDAPAGAVNLVSTIDVVTRATGRDTRAGQLMEMVERCAQERAPVVQMADRIAGVFVGIVIALATTTLVGWLFIEPGSAVEHAVAVLIVTCPCALGLATPLAVIVAIGRASRKGIFIKGGGTLESMKHAGTIVLDKTGTITKGRASVVRYEGAEALKALVVAVERESNHPVARALVRDLGEADAEWVEVRAVHTLGGGVEAEAGGRRVLVGSAGFVRERADVPFDAQVEGWIEAALRDGHTPVVVAVDGSARAVVSVDDAIREDSAAALERIRAGGWAVEILSGDHPRVVDQVGEALGIDEAHRRGGATPEMKALRIKELVGTSGRRPVVMVGDGVNDAAALASATVGVAVHGGAEASMAAADVYLDREGLGALADLIDGSRRAFRVIRRNLVVSVSYNAVFASLAMAGFVDPLAAAVLMPISSLSVVLLSYRSGTF